jgi:hypothetical protein
MGNTKLELLYTFLRVLFFFETSIVKKIYKWKPVTRRPVRRPKSRWEDDVRNGLKKMKLIKRAEQFQDRLKWKDIVEKAKTLLKLQRHRRRKRLIFYLRGVI